MSVCGSLFVFSKSVLDVTVDHVVVPVQVGLFARNVARVARVHPLFFENLFKFNYVAERIAELRRAAAATIIARAWRSRKIRRFERLCRTPPHNGVLTSYHRLRQKWDKRDIDHFANSL